MLYLPILEMHRLFQIALNERSSKQYNFFIFLGTSVSKIKERISNVLFYLIFSI